MSRGDFRVDDGGDLAKMAKAFRSLEDGKEIRKEFTKALRVGTKPAVAAAKAAALGLPAAGRKSTGLRRRLARAIGAEIRLGGKQAGIRVRVRRTAMGDQASLARVTNDGRWRHPVYGQRTVWVTQTSDQGWFDRANATNARPVRRALEAAVEDVGRKLNTH